MIYSFDIFDTCLVRACGSPRTVFSLMAQRLNPDCDFVRDFVLRRLQAEQNAISSLKKEAVTINDIYNCFDLRSINQTGEQMIEMEMSVEEQMLYPARTVLDKINALHDKGKSVLFISDMYLPSSFLKKILHKQGFWKEGDSIFISGEYGVTKQTGNLFRHIAKSLNITFKNWLHCGDNPVGDVRVPGRLGIKTCRIKHGYSRYEKQWLKNAPLSFDREMCEYLAGACRAVRTSNSQDERISIAANVIAPSYISFVFHIFNQARQKGITHLYFTARDSWLFYRIALKISHLYPGIQLSYVRLSRRALWLPSLYGCEPEDFTAFGNLHNYAPYYLLSKMFNVPDDVIFKQAGSDDSFLMQQLSKNTVSDFLRFVQTPEIKNCICARSSSARKLLMEYLQQERLPENAGHAAIIDLGWGNSCRCALNKILTNEGYENIHTFYFGVISGYVPYDTVNPYSAMMVMEKHIHSVSVFEYYFSLTAQSSTTGYASDGETVKPLFEEEDNSNLAGICDLNMDTVLSAVELLLKFPDVENRIKYTFQHCGLSSIEQFLLYPSRTETGIFKEMYVGDIDGKQPFFHPYLFMTLLRRLLGRRYRKIFWISGAITVAFPLSGKFLCKLFVKCMKSKYPQRIFRRLKKRRVSAIP